MPKISFKFLCLAYRIYNVLGEKGGERATGGSRGNPKKKKLEISFIFFMSSLNIIQHDSCVVYIHGGVTSQSNDLRRRASAKLT